MRIKLFTVLFMLMVFARPGIVAAETAPTPDVQGDVQGEMQTESEPEVTIIKRGTDVIEEYRVNGHLYKIKVMPKKGYAYYLVDTDGDGNFETWLNELGDNVLIPQWTLFSW